MSDEHTRILALPLKVKILLKLVVFLLGKLDNYLEPYEMSVYMSILGKEEDETEAEPKVPEVMQ